MKWRCFGSGTKVIWELVALDGAVMPLRRKFVLCMFLDAQLAEVPISKFFQTGDELQPFLENVDLPTVTQALITSRLNYCNLLYAWLSLKMAQKLYLVSFRMWEPRGFQ